MPPRGPPIMSAQQLGQMRITSTIFHLCQGLPDTLVVTLELVQLCDCHLSSIVTVQNIAHAYCCICLHSAFTFRQGTRVELGWVTMKRRRRSAVRRKKIETANGAHGSKDRDL